MLENLWHTPKEKIEQKSVFWNMMSSGLNSVVSMFLLWIVTMINGVSDCRNLFTCFFNITDDVNDRKLWDEELSGYRYTK